jgi:hypothetical protein
MILILDHRGQAFSPTGGATVTAPAKWDYDDVRAYYKGSPSFAIRSATRTLPATVLSSPGGSAKKTNIGAIAGGTVASLLALIVILCLILFCLHRRKKAKDNGAPNNSTAPSTGQAAPQSPQEMSTSGAVKYVPAHEQPSLNELPAYSGLAAVHSRTTSSDQASSINTSNQLQAYNSTQRYLTEVYSSLRNNEHDQSSQSPLRSPNNAELFSLQNHDHEAHDAQQANMLHQTPAGQRQYSYPTPTSPQQTVDMYTQQHPQTYYPPPRSSSYSLQDSRPLATDQGGSPTDGRYIKETQYRSTPFTDTSNTLAQGFTQPVPIRVPGDSSGARYSAAIPRPEHTTSNQWSM